MSARLIAGAPAAPDGPYDVDIIILAQDSKAILPALDRAKAQGVPAIAYDAPIDSPEALFVSFDNVVVGHPHVDSNNVERILGEGYRFLMAAPVRSYAALDKGLKLAGRA